MFDVFQVTDCSKTKQKARISTKKQNFFDIMHISSKQEKKLITYSS